MFFIVLEISPRVAPPGWKTSFPFPRFSLILGRRMPPNGWFCVPPKEGFLPPNGGFCAARRRVLCHIGSVFVPSNGRFFLTTRGFTSPQGEDYTFLLYVIFCSKRFLVQTHQSDRCVKQKRTFKVPIINISLEKFISRGVRYELM